MGDSLEDFVGAWDFEALFEQHGNRGKCFDCQRIRSELENGLHWLETVLRGLVRRQGDTDWTFGRLRLRPAGEPVLVEWNGSVCTWINVRKSLCPNDAGFSKVVTNAFRALKCIQEEGPPKLLECGPLKQHFAPLCRLGDTLFVMNEMPQSGKLRKSTTSLEKVLGRFFDRTVVSQKLLELRERSEVNLSSRHKQKSKRHLENDGEAGGEGRGEAINGVNALTSLETELMQLKVTQQKLSERIEKLELTVAALKRSRTSFAPAYAVFIFIGICVTLFHFPGVRPIDWCLNPSTIGSFSLSEMPQHERSPSLFKRPPMRKLEYARPRRRHSRKPTRVFAKRLQPQRSVVISNREMSESLQNRSEAAAEVGSRMSYG